MNVVFTTLFMALMVGPQTVEVAVEGPVAEVEFLLDGRLVAVDEQPPWKARVDFGETLAPHVLEVVARNDRQQEVFRRLIAGVTSIDDVDWSRAEQLVHELGPLPAWI